MESEIGGAPGSGTVVLAAAAFCGAALLAGLMTAYQRISGLYRNGLLEDSGVGQPLLEYLAAARRFLATVSTLYLVLTVLGCYSWARLLLAIWTGSAGVRFYLVLACIFVPAWTLTGIASKRVAARAPLGYARVLGPVLLPLYWLLRPWSGFVLWLTGRMDEGLWKGEALPHLSPGEIRSLLEGEAEHLTLEKDERAMIHSIFGFHETTVREIMVPRIDMVSLDASDPVERVIPVVNGAHHSRIPVYDGSVDKVAGILYAKDLLDLVQGDRLVAVGKVVGDLMRPAYYIPESKKIDEVLAEFRTKRVHMGIVIDEYGGTAGLVTLEDVLEEIVGEIEDEFDEEEELVHWVDDRHLSVDPKIDLEDLEEVLGQGLPHEGSETLGGLIYEAAAKVPEAGEQVQVAGFTVTVEEVVDQRIVRVTLAAPEAFPGHARHAREEEDQSP